MTQQAKGKLNTLVVKLDLKNGGQESPPARLKEVQQSSQNRGFFCSNVLAALCFSGENFNLLEHKEKKESAEEGAAW